MKAIYLLGLLLFVLHANAANGIRVSSGPSKLTTGFSIGATILYPVGGRTFEGSGRSSPSGNGIKSSFEFEALPSPYVFAKYAKDSWGVSVGYEMILDSKLSGGTVNNAGVKTPTKQFTLLKSMSVNVLHAGAEYRVRSFYFPVELLFVDPPEVTADSASIGFRKRNGPGYSGGVGYQIMNRLNAELLYRTLTLGLGEFVNATDFYDYGKITSTEVVLGVSFHY